MAEQNTEMSVMGVTRYSNEQAKRITRECIETAMIQLLETQEMHKISISELVKRAGVSRTAFYSHYQTKEDVLKSALDDAIDQISQLVLDNPQMDGFWENLFTETAKIAAPFRLLLKAGMGNQILDEITERLLIVMPCDSLHRYNEILWAGAIYNVLSYWIMVGTEAPEEMAKLCTKIVNVELE